MRPLSRSLYLLVALFVPIGPAVAERGSSVACAACKLVASASGAEAACERAAGASAQLERWRNDFLASPRYSLLFPMLFRHVVHMEMQWIAAGRFAHPLQVLRQINVIYDAYAWNRARFATGLPPEPHWREHFSAAAEADREFGQIGRGMAFDTPDAVDRVRGAGIVAHIDFVLPRGLRDAFVARGDKALTAEQIEADFLVADDLVTIATADAVADIKAAVRATSDWNPTLSRPEALGWFDDTIAHWRDEVRRRRRLAFATAFGTGPLPTGDAPGPNSGPRPRIECSRGTAD